jgi:hypothetical protein
MELKSLVGVVALACPLLACAPRPAATAQLPSTTLQMSDGGGLDVRELAARAPLTVLVFFSPACHCLDQHDARIRALAEAYRPRGVQLVMVDSEVRGSTAADLEQARARGYAFPIARDPGGRLAKALDAQYATYSVVVDAKGEIRYRGGWDSDKTHLRDDATPYVREALDDLLAGRPPRVAETKTLGCALETW